jgi:hypothetical protein
MKRAVCMSMLLAMALPASSFAQPAIAAPYDTNYSFTSLGNVPDVPANYGGINFLAGDPNTLLIGGAANTANGAIYQIGLTRDGNNRITGFSGPATLYATAPFIDGGLAYGPTGVLFATTYSNNNILQYKPGSTTPDKAIDLTSLGVASSTGSLQFVPTGFAGAGGFRIYSYSSGDYYTADLVADGTGTFDIANVNLITNTGGGPEGVVFVPLGSPLFPNPAVLVSEYQAGMVRAYDLDANGHPDPATRRDFVTGLSGAEGALIDPLTNDFLFSTFGSGSELVVVSGFAAVPEPSTMIMVAGVGIGTSAVMWRKRKHSKRKK